MAHFSEDVWSSSHAGHNPMLHGSNGAGPRPFQGEVSFHVDACNILRGHLLREDLAAFADTSEAGPWRLALVDLATLTPAPLDPLSNGAGILTPSAGLYSGFDSASSSPPAWIGLEVWHATAVLDAITGTGEDVSRSVAIEITP